MGKIKKLNIITHTARNNRSDRYTRQILTMNRKIIGRYPSHINETIGIKNQGKWRKLSKPFTRSNNRTAFRANNKIQHLIKTKNITAQTTTG
jgi:chromosome condensin MukBEF complex kleisin-like MukF subunit